MNRLLESLIAQRRNCGGENCQRRRCRRCQRMQLWAARKGASK